MLRGLLDGVCIIGIGFEAILQHIHTGAAEGMLITTYSDPCIRFGRLGLGFGAESLVFSTRSSIFVMLSDLIAFPL